MSDLHDSNTIRILVSSDNHVGYNERDPIRGDDSWITFDEIMTTAKDREVDMVILAGDLFHENKPSKKSMYQVIKSLRNNCFGEKPCELELLSDPSVALTDPTECLNYEDANINVAIPVIAISGNHDDAGGAGSLSAADILSASGLVNHIGKVKENDNISLAPLLFRKGSTRLALYGMENVRDERLFRTFRDQKVKFLRPESAGSRNEYFNLMMVHQNHHAHTETNYLPEHYLPSFLDLVIWGHEHECLIDPRINVETGFRVIQPGSSVATSLCEGEAVEKYIGILSISNTSFELEKIRLKTIRPFVMKEIVLAHDCPFPAEVKFRNDVLCWLIEQVDILIQDAHNQWRVANSSEEDGVFHGHNKDPPAPLVRLRVEYSGGYEVENPRRFSNRFIGRVANVNDVVQFYRKKSTSTSKRTNLAGQAIEVVDAVELSDVKVQTIVKEYLSSFVLEVLPSDGLDESISQFVDKSDKQAIKAFVDDTIESQVKRLLTLGDVNEEDINHAITRKSALPSSHAVSGEKRRSEGFGVDADEPVAGNPRKIQLNAASLGRLNKSAVDTSDPETNISTRVSRRHRSANATTMRGLGRRQKNGKALFIQSSSEEDQGEIISKPAVSAHQNTSTATTKRSKSGRPQRARHKPIADSDSDDEIVEDSQSEVSDDTLPGQPLSPASRHCSTVALPVITSAKISRKRNFSKLPTSKISKPQGPLNLLMRSQNRHTTAPLEIVSDSDDGFD
ncbi:Metallo-dependent phosphatase-like protein [Lipomyces oligophaga]|uniref:Metallo-dependent phosphatase-like protein n=1 Tax=Lipomyces oligophaga TaxID=45792 RepID=UPI0034D013B0